LTIRRFEAAALSWALSDDITDTEHPCSPKESRPSRLRTSTPCASWSAWNFWRKPNLSIFSGCEPFHMHPDEALKG
jgi:hypothetical protein